MEDRHPLAVVNSDLDNGSLAQPDKQRQWNQPWGLTIERLLLPLYKAVSGPPLSGHRRQSKIEIGAKCQTFIVSE